MSGSGPSERRPNRLADETSPYLLQHRYNPVDWSPWGDEALAGARELDRPIFLSIGYAACHWCHVMERESFEDDEIAALLNRAFVPIKVDREERPDLDEIYMNAVQLMTGHGGWPMSVFLTPALEPFFGGTYFPPRGRHAQPGFLELLEQVHEAWQSRRDEVERSAGRMTEELRRLASGAVADEGDLPGHDAWARAIAELASRFDGHWGGFGRAPKFPPDGALALLLREHVATGHPMPLKLAERTLDAMAVGGLFDQVGGGFARYSVDEAWLVPHFEKMLYSQALLVPLYADAWRVTGKPLYRRVVERTLDFVRRELADPAGGFHASLDADSEGEEGRFYVWTPDEVEAVLGAEDGRRFCELFGIDAEGNFEGRSIPHLLRGDLEQVARERALDATDLVDWAGRSCERLLAARGRRTRPATDDKVLTAWNGLMLGALAHAHAVLGRPEDLAAAKAAARFLLGTMRTDEGRLRATYRDGRARLNAYLDDHAFVVRGLIELYEACFEPEWLEAAVELADTLLARFEDPERGGFFFVSDDHETLLTRNRSQHDGALPSGGGVACEALLRLATHTGRDDYAEAARRALRSVAPALARMPSGFASWLVASDLERQGPLEVAIAGGDAEDGPRRMLEVVRRRFRPRLALAVSGPGDPGEARRGSALLRDRPAIGGRATAYVCRGRTCDPPVSDPSELERALDAAPA